MNEKELQELYNLILSKDSTYGNDVSYDMFKQKMSNAEYSEKIKTWSGYKAKPVTDVSGVVGTLTQPELIQRKQMPAQRKPIEPVSTTAASTSATIGDERKPDQEIVNKVIEAYRPRVEEPEKDYFTGALLDAKNSIDKAIPIGIGEFVEDMARSVAGGWKQGKVSAASNDFLINGSETSYDQIQKYIDASKNYESIGSSDAMREYQKTYEKEGSNFFGFVKALWENPLVLPEVVLSSMSQLASNPEAVKAFFSVAGTATVAGAGAGSPGGVPGAIAGAVAAGSESLPYAFALAGSISEMGATFSELLGEELGGNEMTKENVKEILEDPEKLNRMRTKAVLRGIVIGAIDAYTGKLASGVGAKIIEKSAAKSGVGVATRAAVVKSTAASSAIEGVGGSFGEASARAAIGQDMDISEIALEGVSELPGGIRSTIQARLAKPEYKINGSKVSEETLDRVIETMTPEQLSKAKIDIKNDFFGKKKKIQDKVVSGAIRNQVVQASPNLSEENLSKVVELEKELKKLEGNTTQLGKDKASEIRSQIKQIQENAIQEQATNEGVLRQEGSQVGLQEVVQGDQGTGVEGAQQGQEQTIAAPAQITGLSISDPEVDTRVTDEKQKGVLSFARKAVSAISSIMPGVEFIVHDNSDSYTAAVSQRLGKESKDVAGTSGYFSYGVDGSLRIDIDLSSANSRTVAHEVTHAVLYKKFNEDFTLFKDFRNRLSGVISSMAPQDFVTEAGTDVKVTTVKDQLADFVSRYDGQSEDVQAEEFITELSAMLTSNEAKISTSGWNKISTFIGDFVSKITGGKVNLFEGAKTTRDVVDFFNSMSKAIATGEDISGINFARRGGQAPATGQVAQGVGGKASISNFPKVTTTLQKDGTGIGVNGNESILKGDNASTVYGSAKGIKDDYTTEDILSTNIVPRDRLVSLAYSIANGVISYRNKTTKKIVNFDLPIVNKDIAKKINNLRNKYKNTPAKDTAKRAKIKNAISDITKNQLMDFQNTMTQNILALYDTLTSEFISVSKNWYLGANRIAQSISNKYNIDINKSGAIIAVLSPQNDWFNNVSVAERVSDVMSNYADTKLTKDIVDRAVEYNKNKGSFVRDLTKMFSKYGEISINELQALNQDVSSQSLILRAIDHAFNSPKVAVTDPNGKFIRFASSPVRWNSALEISKAISVFRTKTIEDINLELGNGNKVRNFYNNIVDPNSKTPYVTADTHAFSAALNSPISAEDASGAGLFLGGKEPLYALVKGAYIDAASIVGIKPREMQSIIWEAQRMGINDRNRSAETKQKSFEYIKNNRTDERSTYERATELISRNRSTDPTWAGSTGIKTQKPNTEILEGSRLRSEQRFGEISSLRGPSAERVGGAVSEVGGAVAGRGDAGRVKGKASRIAPEGTEKNDAAKTQGFFSDVVSGLSDKYKPIKPWAPVVEFTKDQSSFKSIFDKYMGNFDMHIATSIPTFRETQVKVGNAITEMYSGSDGVLVYDLGGSEGGFVKAITESSDGSIKSINLDPNPEMAAAHNSKPVDGSEVIQDAFYSGFEENGVEYKTHEPSKKADVVHESMMFQFITPERAQYIKEVKDKYIKEDGLFLTEEKFSQEKSIYAENEKQKAEYKDEYYTKEQQAMKSDDVLVGMKENQADLNDYKKVLEDNFKYVSQYWDSGNFKGFVASDNESRIKDFIKRVGDTSSKFSSEKFKSEVKGKASKTAPIGFENAPTEDLFEITLLVNRIDDWMNIMKEVSDYMPDSLKNLLDNYTKELERRKVLKKEESKLGDSTKSKTNSKEIYLENLDNIELTTMMALALKIDDELNIFNKVSKYLPINFRSDLEKLIGNIMKERTRRNQLKPEVKGKASRTEPLITDKKILSQMTEDNDGNFLFYHVSPNRISGKIDPKFFGRNLKTGKDERPGIGISMYYTRPDRADVSGEYKYVAAIPKDKVYPFNSDPLDLYDKAKASFEKMYPGQAFDPNKQVAFISREAEKLGYQMTVAKWGDGLRAQTTKAIRPEWLERPNGNKVEVNEKFKDFKANSKTAVKGKASMMAVEETAKALEGADITANNDDLFNKIKGSKWNTMPYTIDQIVKKWDKLKDNSNDNIKTIKYLIKTPSKNPIVLNSNGDVIDGYHRITSNKISGISKVKYVFDDGSFDINEPFTEDINKNIAEAYHKAKEDGSNPELVKAVENVIGAKPEVKGKASRMAPENIVSENTLPGYDSLVAGIAKYVSNAISRGDAKADIVRTAVDIAQSSPIYESANDVQREQIVREARKAAGASQKSSPSVSRLFGIKPKDVTMTELQALNKQISDLARGARESKNNINERRRNLSDAVRKLAVSGNVSAKKVAAIINKISNLNLYNTKKVNEFIQYATNVFADADYAEKLSIANATRKQIKKLSKSADKFANLRDLGSRFSEIDPSLVSDIDEYNNIASLVKESIKGSTVRGTDPVFARIANEEQVNEYISDTIDSQDQQLLDAKIEEAQDLLGFDATGMTYDEILELLEPNKTIAKDVENIIRAGINKAFDIYKTIINDILSTGVDSFTGDPVNYSDNQKRVISEFININPGDLKIKNALEAVDALVNFITNGSIAKMESVVERYNGEQNMIRANRNGVRASSLRKYGSKLLGQLLVEQTASLNILFERMFGGFTRGGFMEKMMGITDIKNGVSKAKSEADAVVKKYVEMFYDKKANGQDFNTAYNNIERGMIAFLVKGIYGTQKETKAEFDRRKNLATESINQLEKGNDQEKEKAKIYQQVFDKIAQNSSTAQDVINAADRTNLSAVDFWIDGWADRYYTLSDVALGIYNKVLGRDVNYTPDRFSKLSYGISEVDMSSEDMSFIFNSGNASFYKKETGVLMKATKPDTLPSERYVDLSFDNNNANSLYDALVDVNTAGAIRRSESAMNSSAFQNIVESVDDRKLLVRRVKLYVNNVRKKSPFSDDTFATVAKRLNRLATIGVGQALGGILQPIKQVVPIAINTLINAGGLNVSSISNRSIQDFINKSGYAIASRGIESQAQIETLDKMIEQAATSRGGKAIEKIEAANKWWLKNFLVKFDVAIARASWITYYEQYLKKEGLYETVIVNQTTASGTLTVSVPGIDYSNHKLNDQAADYAQRQVDRQQNVSDSDLSGAILSSKDPAKQLFTKILMPFASFRMNQSARLGSDISTLLNKTATKEDKKIAARSAAGFVAEMATFRAISYGSALVIAEVAAGMMGKDDDDEEEKKKREAILKGQLTSTVADMFSPAPIVDRLVQNGVSKALESTQDMLDVEKEDRVGIYSGDKQTFFQSLGLLGITGERAAQLWEMASLSTSGKFTDDFGNKKQISEKDKSALSMLIPISILSTIGLAPSEANSVVRSSVRLAKKDAEKADEDGEYTVPEKAATPREKKQRKDKRGNEEKERRKRLINMQRSK